MPRFQVDVEQTNYGIIDITARDEEEAIRKVNEGQPMIEEDVLFTGSSVRGIHAEPKYD